MLAHAKAHYFEHSLNSLFLKQRAVQVEWVKMSKQLYHHTSTCFMLQKGVRIIVAKSGLLYVWGFYKVSQRSTAPRRATSVPIACCLSTSYKYAYRSIMK